MKNPLELSLILSIVGYLVCKIFNLQPIYPVIFPVLLGISVFRQKKKLWLTPLWGVAGAFIYLWITSGSVYVHWQVAAALGLIPIMLMWFHYVFHPAEKQKNLVQVIKVSSWAFLALVVIGIILRAQEFFEIVSTAFQLGHWTRGSSNLRYFMVSILVPWSGDIFLGTVFRTFIELLTMWAALFLFTRDFKRDKGLLFTFLGLLAYCMIASSRGAIVISVFLAASLMLDLWPLLRRWAILAVVPIPVFISMIDSPALSGRSVMYRGALKGLGFFGNGLGSSSVLAEKLSKGERNQLHNIFLEITYDWGVLFYTFVCGATFFYLMKLRYYRVAVVIFVAGSMGYTAYSPWFIWTIFFAYLIDRRQLELSLPS